MYCEEKDRSWCTSSKENDNRAVTIEVSNISGGPEWAVTDAAMLSLLNLCADICRRNGIKKLLWRADKNLIGQVDKQNMTVHRWFANKDCPGEFLYNKMGWIADEVNKMLGVCEIPKPMAPATPPAANVEKVIWPFFSSKGLPPEAVAGLMGNLYAESGLRADNLQNSFQSVLNMDDATYTAAVDSGVYTNFVNDGAGYGLAQWTYHTRKQALLDYAKTNYESIGNLHMQLDFLWKELLAYTGLVTILKAAKTVREASDAVLLIYERPADQSVAVQEKRAGFGQRFFDRFAADALPDGVQMAPFSINGAIVDLPRIIIQDRNYVRLDKLCEALGVKLGYDESQGMALIETRMEVNAQ
jgi:hypothetical protein